MNSDELYISFFFPPSDYVSGVTVFKRIVESGTVVDVLQARKDSSNPDLNECADEYINRRIMIDIDCDVDWTDCIFKFVKSAIGEIPEGYKRIYSRSWLMSNHFLASEYKFQNPNTVWTAEFSDPLIYDLSNTPKYYKQMTVDDEAYIDKINNKIKLLNEKYDTDFALVENNVQAYYIAEYLCYLFADKLVFTNENQREVMLKQFPEDIYDFAFKKSEVRMHPTLDEKFYHIKEIDLDLDNDFINLAYFGKDYYGKRHFESLFYSVESLNHKYKDRIKIHLFLSDDEIVESLVNSLNSSDNFIVEKPLEYLEFLNATTQFDVLIVNDVLTHGNYEINPYLSSKLSDYLGSSADIWAFYERGSSLSKFDLKYKSDIHDYASARDELIRILNDRGFEDENCTFDDDYIIKRFTQMNELYETVFRRNFKLESEVARLKKENSQMKSSNSWKITKPLRKLKNK